MGVNPPYVWMETPKPPFPRDKLEPLATDNTGLAAALLLMLMVRMAAVEMRLPPAPNTRNAAILGLMSTLHAFAELKMTVSPAPGTPEGVQLPATFQLAPLAPFQVLVWEKQILLRKMKQPASKVLFIKVGFAAPEGSNDIPKIENRYRFPFFYLLTYAQPGCSAGE